MSIKKQGGVQIDVKFDPHAFRKHICHCMSLIVLNYLSLHVPDSTQLFVTACP